MKLYIVTAAYHHEMDGRRENEMLVCGSKAYRTRRSAKRCLQAEIRSAVYNFYMGATIDDDEIESIVDEILKSGEGDCWEWFTADQLMQWRIIRDELPGGRECR